MRHSYTCMSRDSTTNCRPMVNGFWLSGIHRRRRRGFVHGTRSNLRRGLGLGGSRQAKSYLKGLPGKTSKRILDKPHPNRLNHSPPPSHDTATRLFVGTLWLQALVMALSALLLTEILWTAAPATYQTVEWAPLRHLGTTPPSAGSRFAPAGLSPGTGQR